MASLIDECVSIKKIVERDRNNYKSVPKIIADGGFNNYDDIIKALALGADYVMCGKIFAQCEEACGEKLQKFLYSDGAYKYLDYYDAIKAKEYMNKANYFSNALSAKIDINKTSEPYPITAFNEIYRNYYGMSTKKAQKEMGKENIQGNKLKIISPIFLIGMMPFVWMFICNNHSAVHYWMISRILSITILKLFPTLSSGLAPLLL